MGMIWLISCGETISSPEGGASATLSAQGLAQAEAVAEKFTDYPLAALYLLPGPAVEEMAAPLAQRARLIRQTCTRGEFENLASRYLTAEIALIAASSDSSELIARLLDLPLDHTARIAQDPGAINRILTEPHRTVIAGVNDLCHLEAYNAR